jgi:hypothetical protein
MLRFERFGINFSQAHGQISLRSNSSKAGAEFQNFLS